MTAPAHHGDERTALLSFLQRQRDLVVWKVSGASDAVLRSVATPTGLTLPGLVRHLTNVERSWFRRVFAGETGLVFDWSDADPDGDLKVPDGVPMAELLAEYTAESARCDEVLRAAGSLDEVSALRDLSLRWVVLHLIEETARHLGHIDVLREQADGVVGEEPGE
ncbi:DinB family protein [Saccharopolyspora sp. NPDC050389]|uniref:DinB family protein n=1 Tax=Saccharopolyspora sp. NPDC050389 TaxID=3155516 RepID=UPI0034015539